MELPWSNLLAMANAMTGTPWLYFVLFLQVSLDLTFFQMGLLMGYLYFLRWIANNTVTYVFDRLSRRYSIFLILFCVLVGISGLSVFILLSSYSSLLNGVTDSSDAYHFYIVMAALTLFGAFYLSLGVLVESVILKSWGEYRMYFYGHHRPWSEWTVVCLTGIIGILCTLFATLGGYDDPADLLPPLFTGMILLGVLVMCIIAVFKIQYMPSDPTCLGLTPSTPWALKNAVLQSSDLLLLPSYFAPYKPYSIFGESLSHISEEDASMVQRMSSHPSLVRESSRTSSQSAHSFTTIPPIPIMNNNGSLMNLPDTPSSYGAMMYPSSTPTTDPLNFIPPWIGSHSITSRRLSSNTSYSYDPIGSSVMDDDEIGRESSLNLQNNVLPISSWNTIPSYELALFSFVPPEMASIATLPFILYYLHNRNDHITINHSTKYSTTATTPLLANTYMPGPALINPPPVDQWKLRSLQITLFLLGCVSAMLQVFLFVYLYECLDLPMLVIGLSGSCVILSEIMLLTTVTKWIHRMNLTSMTTFIHATLIICAFTFLWLRPYHGFTTVAAFILPLAQSGTFYMAWLVTSDRINTLVWSDTQRMFQRAILSTLFCTVGPIVGVILTGYLISPDLQSSSFSSVYHAAIGLLALSFVISWGWSTDE